MPIRAGRANRPARRWVVITHHPTAMSRLAQLRIERHTLADQANELNEKYKAAQMPRAESSRLDGMLDRLEAIDREIEEERARAEEAGAAITRGARGMFEINGNPVRAIRDAASIRAHYAQSRMGGVGADLTLSNFVRGVAGMPTTESVRAALTTGTDSAGGHLLPSVVMPRILEALVPASSLLSAGASILPLDVGAKSFTIAGVDTIPTAAWRLENGDIAESDPTFRAVVAEPKSLAFFFKVSRELLADGAGIDQALIMAMAQAFAKALDLAGLRGSGTDPEPRGVKDTTGVNPVGNGANGASLATTRYANFFSAVKAVLEADAPPPTAAIMSPRSRIVLGGLADTTGQPLMVPDMLKPLQLLTTSQIPNDLTVGTSTDCSEIYVGDFTRVFFAMRERMSIMRLTEAFATKGQVGFMAHVRGDVLVTYPKALAVVTGVRP